MSDKKRGPAISAGHHSTNNDSASGSECKCDLCVNPENYPEGLADSLEHARMVFPDLELPSIFISGIPFLEFRYEPKNDRVGISLEPTAGWMTMGLAGPDFNGTFIESGDGPPTYVIDVRRKDDAGHHYYDDDYFSDPPDPIVRLALANALERICAHLYSSLPDDLREAYEVSFSGSRPDRMFTGDQIDAFEEMAKRRKEEAGHE